MRGVRGVHRPRPDANHAQVARWYQELLCLVADTHESPFWSDLVVGIPTAAGRIMQGVEVKTCEGRESPAQKTLQTIWGGSCIRTVRTLEDVVKHVRDVQGRFKRMLEAMT